MKIITLVTTGVLVAGLIGVSSAYNAYHGTQQITVMRDHQANTTAVPRTDPVIVTQTAADVAASHRTKSDGWFASTADLFIKHPKVTTVEPEYRKPVKITKIITYYK